MVIRQATHDDHPQLLNLWLRSVRATHHFLQESDIEELYPPLRDIYLPAVELWVAVDTEDCPMGFIGIAENHVEMLFIEPDLRGKGIGRALLDHAVRAIGLVLMLTSKTPKRLGFTCTTDLYKPDAPNSMARAAPSLCHT